jgi:dissimilatory sulfite reductase (desulfoviridin) alpha/beta subunit
LTNPQDRTTLESWHKLKIKEVSMEWDSLAGDEFVKMPLSTSSKQQVKVFIEKVARKNGSDKVTLKEIDEAKKVYYAGVPEELRIKEYDKRIAEGETDLRQRMDKEARDILSREMDMFDVELCHARNFRCQNQNIEVRELKKEVEQKLRELNLTELIADLIPDGQRIMTHDRVRVSISACPNGCTAPESRVFGVAGVAKPMVTDNVCSECFACVDRCRKRAILIRNGGPEIDVTRCDCCGQCIKACPDDVLAYENSGYKIWVGGHIGRFPQYGYVLFRMADKETLFRSLEASIELIREESLGEESLTSIINRLGVAPLFQKIYSLGVTV